MLRSWASTPVVRTVGIRVFGYERHVLRCMGLDLHSSMNTLFVEEHVGAFTFCLSAYVLTAM
jgi:hypothetical protein